MQLNKQLLVSVYMITYNHKDYIKQAVVSVMMQQTTFNFHLYIGEDCSTDSTREICKELYDKYPDKITLILNEKNLGATQNAFNTFRFCLQSGSKYIAMLEGDDYWTDPLKLQKQVDFLEGNLEYVMTYHDVSIVNKDGDLLKESKTPAIYKRDFSSLEIMKCEIFVCTMSLVFRNKVKTLPKEFLNVKNGDIFLTSFLGQFGKGKYIENIDGKYRVHDGGVWSSLGNKQKVESRKNTFFQLHKYYKSINNREISDFYLLKSKDTPSQGSKRSFKNFITRFLRRSYKKINRLLNG